MRSDRRADELLVDNLSDLPISDVERLARSAIFDDGALTASDLKPLMEAKYRLLERGSALSFEYDTARFAEVGGMRQLTSWIERRRAGFAGHAGLDVPKGVLLLGIQGCGTRMAARDARGIRRAAAASRCRRAPQLSTLARPSATCARRSTPPRSCNRACCGSTRSEKRLSTGDGDAGTSRRVLGTFLTWVAEKKTRVFIVATANDMTSLAPERVRKSRFDEIFFVDLPRADAAIDILRLQATRRGLALSDAELREWTAERTVSAD